MGYMVDWVASLGDAAVSATTATAFDFSSAGSGNALRFSCEQGGLMRVNLTTDDPTSAIATVAEDEIFVYCDAGNVEVYFPARTRDGEMISGISIYSYSAMTNVGVTLGVIAGG